MNTHFWRRCGRLWCQGVLLCGLRFAQLRTGFDPDTGLPVPCLPGTLLLALLGFCALVELVLCLRMPKRETGRFTRPGDSAATAVVIGGMLLAAGGLLLLLSAVPARDLASAVTGVLAVAAGAGMVGLVWQLRSYEGASVGPTLPAMFFGMFLVLEVYLPSSSDPVLARFYIPLLAAALTAYAFSQLAGQLRGEENNRAFVFTADMTVLVCLTSLADGVPARMLVYVGTAVVLTVFLLLRQSLPKQEEAAEPASFEEPQL